MRIFLTWTLSHFTYMETYFAWWSSTAWTVLATGQKRFGQIVGVILFQCGELFTRHHRPPSPLILLLRIVPLLRKLLLLVVGKWRKRISGARTICGREMSHSITDLFIGRMGGSSAAYEDATEEQTEWTSSTALYGPVIVVLGSGWPIE